jgi:hypothetical protein
MKILRDKVTGLLLAMGLVFGINASAEPSVERDATNWFATLYWPHWSNANEFELAVVKRFFSEDFRYLTGDSAPYVGEFPPPEFPALIDEYQADGWIGDELLDVNAKYINSQTVTIKNRFASRFADGSAIEACMWYLLHKYKSVWRINTVALRDCTTG